MAEANITNTTSALVRVEGLRKLFSVTAGLFSSTHSFIHAVDDVNFVIRAGRSLGLVGESGCGKTTTGKLLVRLLDPTDGHIYLADSLSLPKLNNGEQAQVDQILLENGASVQDALVVQAGQPVLTIKTGSGKIQKVKASFAGVIDDVLVKPGDTVRVGDALMSGWADLARLRGHSLKSFRRRVQMIFQDPYESLNPRLTVYDAVAEPLVVQGLGTLVEREERVAELLELVGLTPASSFMFRFPHELSGGQRQRVAIARALIIEPIFIAADEPTSMLDVSIRTGVMQLMMDLADRFGVSYLYITHDLAVARYMCQEIAVMYLGKIVEQAETEELLSNPLHPYTRALISAVPVPDPRTPRETIEIEGGVPKPIDPPPQCRFFDRCPIADSICQEAHPPLEDKGAGHFVACYKV
jgi:peptide/nickel transport system ATP-binding protein